VTPSAASVTPLAFGPLEAHLADLLGGEAFSVDASTARAGGMSHLNLLATGTRGSKVIVRVPPERGPLEPYDIAGEVAHYELARASHVPVAPLLELERGSTVVGRPFAVFRYVPGDVLVPQKRWPSEPEGAAIGRELVRTLAAIHASHLTSEPFERLNVAERRYEPADLIERTAAQLHADGRQPLPVILAFVEGWLRRNRPTPAAPTLVHGDYRLGNMIWNGTTIAAVLDWETAMIADPLYDLAWYLMNTFDDDDIVMGVMPRAAVIAAYAGMSGRFVDPRGLGWWEVLVAWIRVAIELHAIRLNEAGSEPDLRALAWEFGHGSAYRHILRIIRRIEVGA
jgi:aminoglycoside phosphotransferase (APT) family kinase protein